MNIHKRDARLDYIIYALSNSGFMTYEELSSKVGGSPRTLQRDLRILKKHYWQIYTKRGNGGGIGFINCNNKSCLFYGDPEAPKDGSCEFCLNLAEQRKIEQIEKRVAASIKNMEVK